MPSTADRYIERPLTFPGGKIYQRRPENRPYPRLAEIYQPDVIERLQRISARQIARYA